MSYDFKIKEMDDGTWVILTRDGIKVAGPFTDALAAARWARNKLIAPGERRQGPDSRLPGGPRGLGTGRRS